jgi:hypothetical protein
MTTQRKEPRAEPKVSIGALSDLFSAEAKSFKLRNDTPAEEDQPQTLGLRDWKQIAFDFLSQSSDIAPLADPQTFVEIDTTRAAEFAAGQGSQNWHELREAALRAAKEKHRWKRK